MTLSRTALPTLLGAAAALLVTVSTAHAAPAALVDPAATAVAAPSAVRAATPTVDELTIGATDQYVEAGSALNYVFNVASKGPSTVGSSQTWDFASGFPSGFILREVNKDAGTWRLATTRPLNAGEGPFSITLRFYDGWGMANKTIKITVVEPLEVTANDLVLDQDLPLAAGTRIFTATKGVAPYQVSIQNNGGISDLAISADGIATGTAPSPGTSTVEFTVTDASGTTRALRSTVTTRDICGRPGT